MHSHMLAECTVLQFVYHAALCLYAHAACMSWSLYYMHILCLHMVHEHVYLYNVNTYSTYCILNNMGIPMY